VTNKNRLQTAILWLFVNRKYTKVGKTSKWPLRNFYLLQTLDSKEKGENLMEINNWEDLEVDGEITLRDEY
jgi:hypothetical protein